MLIPLSTLIKKYNIKPKGILHVGANSGQEAKSYFDCGIPKVIWVECMPEIIPQLRKNVSRFPHQTVVQACVSDVDGQEVTFNVANNEGQSSSFLDLAEHARVHPEVKYIANYKLKTIRLDTLLNHNKIDAGEYDFVGMDIQGVELLALKGLGELLYKVNYLYLEVNRKELYKGCALVGEVIKYIEQFGFEVKEIEWTNFDWGDLYAQRKTTP